jgi:hypothetical protein
MAKLIAGVINIVRIIVLGILVFTLWPTAVALLEGDILWNEAVDSLFSNSVITMLLVVLLLTLLVSIFSSSVARWAVTIAGAAILVCFVTGTITLESVSESVTAYSLADKAKERIEKCKATISVEEFGGQFRAVMKDPSKDKIVGYVDGTMKGAITLLDPNGKPLPCGISK